MDHRPRRDAPAADDAEVTSLERVRDEEFTNLSRASNNSPRGIWSDGEVMYVADESDGRVYSYNLPDAIDARLASLSLSGVEFGEFDPGVTEYEGVAGGRRDGDDGRGRGGPARGDGRDRARGCRPLLPCLPRPAVRRVLRAQRDHEHARSPLRPIEGGDGAAAGAL